MTDLNAYFDQFLRERTYLPNITPKTREFSQTAWKAFTRAHAQAPARPSDAPILTRADLQHFVVHRAQRDQHDDEIPPSAD